MVKEKEADRVLRLDEVLALTGLSRSVLYRLSAQGAFPAQCDTGSRRATWKSSAIQAFIATRVAKAAV